MVLRWRLQLLQEYRTMDDYARMEELGSAGIRMIRENSAGTWEEMELTLYTGSFYAAQILAYMGQEDYLHAYTLCETAKKEKYSTRLFRAFLEEMLAKALFYIGLRKQTLEEGVEFFGNQNRMHSRICRNMHILARIRRNYTLCRLLLLSGNVLTWSKSKKSIPF